MPPKSKKKIRRNKRPQVLVDLRKRIVDGDYPQGFKLIEQELAQEFGISRPILREVLADLESQGLVEKIPNKGTMVRRVSSQSLLEIMEVREVLEGLAARLAAQKSRPEDWLDLVEAFGEPCQGMVENLEFERFLDLVARFRERMVTAARNEELSKQIFSLFAKITIVQRRVVILPGRMQQAIQEHRDILQALVNGDPDRAELMKRKNLKSAREYLMKYKKWVL